MAVPLLDLSTQYHAIKNEIDDAIQGVFETQKFLFGPIGPQLEREIAAYVGTVDAVGVASGTDAILLALRAAGIGPGDEVIVPAFTFFATAGAVHNAGAIPVFADIEPDTFCICPNHTASIITPRTRAIIPVHLFGQCADMDTILKLAAKHDLFVLEDAAQALGARYKGRAACSMGDAGATSFFPSKNLGGAGDGGMTTTRRADLAAQLRLHRNHGQGSTYIHSLVGTNSRLDEIQAAILRVKLPHLDAWNQRRRDHAAWYNHHLANRNGIITPAVRSECEHVYHQYTIRITNRDCVVKKLREHAIGCGVYYPLPLHLQECFTSLGYKPGSLPNAENASINVLSLPIFPELTEEQREEVAREILG